MHISPAELDEALSFARVLVRRRIFHRQDQEDAFAEVRLVILRCAERHEPARGSFVTYAGDSAAGALLKYLERQREGNRGRKRWALRRQGRPVPECLKSPVSLSLAVLVAGAEDLTLYDLIADPESLPAPSDVLTDRIGPALLRLSEPERELLRLRFWEGLSQEAVGRRLGISQMQISRRQRWALDALKAEILTSD